MGQFWRTSGTNTAYPIKEWSETIQNDGLIRYLDFFNGERLVLTKTNTLAEVLVHKTYEFIKPPQLVSGLGRILGIGVFLAEGQEHKTQRKNLMPAFAFRHIKQLYPLFWAKSKELVDILALESVPLSDDGAITTTGQGKAKAIDVNDWCSRATLDIIGVAGLGRDFHALDDTSNELLKTYRQLFTLGRTSRILAMLGFILPPWLVRNLPLKRNDLVQRSSDTIKCICRELIENAKEDLKEEKTRENILSIALKSGGFTEDELANQMMTFLLAGHETTASALSWAICMLSQHPGIQARLQAEVRSALPNPRSEHSTVSAQDIDSLPYLNAVCNEVLRLWPPVVMTVRVAANDATIAGYYVPKGTTIYMSPLAINNSKEFWGEDAHQFVPDRWLGPGKANTGGAESNYAYMTFLHGPRSCIGQSFAKAEFACLLAAWAWTFTTKFADEAYEVQVKNGITAKPKDLKVNLELVDG